ncbi:hypothetical protein V6N13_061072 [Hibiscus sabdariffa]
MNPDFPAELPAGSVLRTDVGASDHYVWVLDGLERGQRRLQLKASVGRVKQSTVPKRRSQPKTATSKQSSIALRIKYKPSPFAQHSVAFNVRKPLQLSLADLPILHRAGYKVGSSNHSSSSKDVYSLDKSRHSSVTLPENSDPNIQLPVPSQQVSNLVVEPPKKPLDPTGTVNTTVHTQETRPVDGHNAALSIDVPALISDAYDSAMLE